MGLFRKKVNPYKKGKWGHLRKVAPVIDTTEDRYSARLVFSYTDDEGVEHPVDLDLSLKELHQLTINLYLVCRTFNLPVDRPLAERARQFWGMGM